MELAPLMVVLMMPCLSIHEMYGNGDNEILIMQEKPDIILKIVNPRKEVCKVQIVTREVGDFLLSQKAPKKRGTYNSGFKQKPIFELNDGSILLSYTVNDFMILLDDFEDAKKIINNDEFSTIVLIRDHQNSFYYSFSVYSNFIKNKMNDLEFKDVGAYEKYLEDNFSPRKPYRLASINDSGVFYFFERAPEVFQGNWFPDMECLDFFFEHGLV